MVIENSDGGRSAIALLRDIQAGILGGSSLAVADRRRIVEHLNLEGYSVQEIAEVLKISDRTITRDRTAIREQNAIKADPKLVGQAVGNMVAQAEASVARLRRIARDKSTPASARVEAEVGAWRVTLECTQSLQKLGYLPTAPQQIQGQFVTASFTGDQLAELQQTRQELQRLKDIAVDESSVRALDATLGEVTGAIVLAEARQRAAEIVESRKEGATDAD
ncbi:MAG: hypothetical protein JSS51_01185 [Planctomycetes bacterium]|nr:hypothetical protein [Planctomycetota bacterium]